MPRESEFPSASHGSTDATSTADVDEAQRRLLANTRRLEELRQQQQRANQQRAVESTPETQYGYDYDEGDTEDFDPSNEDYVFDENLPLKRDADFDEMVAETDNLHVSFGSALDTDAIFKACKYGDLDTLRHFLKAAGNYNLLGVRDNKGRTLLHYAADSGSSELCEYLLSLGFSEALQDDNGITPSDIATVLQRSELLGKVLGTSVKSVTDLELAPSRFFVTRPPPKQPPHVKGSIWGTSNPEHLAPASNITYELTELFTSQAVVPKIEDDTVSDAAALRSPLAGSHPADSGSIEESRYRHILSVYIDGILKGVAVVSPLGKLTLQGSTIPNAAYVLSSIRCVKGKLSDTIKSIYQSFNSCVITWTSAKNLSPVIEPACFFRWYQRVIKPHRIFAAGNTTVSRVFPSFDNYLETLRSDLTRQHAYVLQKKISQWRLAKDVDIRGLSFVAMGNVSFDLTFEASNDSLEFFRQQQRRLGLYVKGEQGAPTAGILLQRRFLEGDTLRAALLLSVFGDLSVSDALEVATLLEDADIVLSSSLAGFNEDALRSAKFSEIEGTGEYLYVSDALNRSLAKNLKPARVRLPVTL